MTTDEAVQQIIGILRSSGLSEDDQLYAAVLAAMTIVRLNRSTP